MPNDITLKIQKARKAGYSDVQIKTFMAAQGFDTSVVDKSPTGFVSGVKNAFNTRVDNAATQQFRSAQGEISPLRATARTIGQGFGFASDIAGEAVKAIPGAEKAIGAVAKPILQSQPAQDAMAAYQQFKTKHPEAALDLEAAGNILSFLPVGASADLAGKTALSAAGKTIGAVGSTVEKAGTVTKGAGDALYHTAITPTVKEAERILAYKSKNPFLTRASNALSGKTTEGAPTLRSDTALSKGIAGTEKMVGIQSKRAADKLWNETIAPAVKASPEVVTKDELFAPAIKLIDQTTDPTRKKALQNALDSLTEDYAGSQSWSLDQAQALKRDLDAFTPTKLFKGQDVASEMRTLQHEMADAIRQKTYNSLSDVNIKKDYLDWANLHELEKVGVKAISEAGFKGGFGSFWSAAWEAATTPVKTIGGQVLYRVGNKLEFLGDKGIKRFGDFLQKQGFQNPSKVDIDTPLKNYAKEVQPGLSMKNSVTPENVAKKMDEHDAAIAKAYLDNPDDLNAYMKAAPTFEAMGIANAEEPTKRRFLKEALGLFKSSKDL